MSVRNASGQLVPEQCCCCCPTDCSSAPALKAAASFSGAYVTLNFTATALTRTGCTWSVTVGGATVSIACVNGGWVVTANGGTSVQCRSDPMHFGSPYPPSGSYTCDICTGDTSAGPITVTISK